MELVEKKRDLWQTAQCLVQLYGMKAHNNAILRSERARLDGDFMAYKSWREIGTKVQALQRGWPLETELN